MLKIASILAIFIGLAVHLFKEAIDNMVVALFCSSVSNLPGAKQTCDAFLNAPDVGIYVFFIGIVTLVISVLFEEN